MSKVRIIFINGTSCVGKTSLARALQKQLGEKWLYIDMDHFIEMMNPNIAVFDKNHPNFLKESPGFYARKSGKGYHIEAGYLAQKLLNDMVDQVQNMANLSWNIIFAGVRPYKKGIEHIKEKLGRFNLLTIYLYANSKIIEERESKRENRLNGSTTEILKRFECGNFHDLSFDSTNKSPEIIAKEIIEKYQFKNYSNEH